MTKIKVYVIILKHEVNLLIEMKKQLNYLNIDYEIFDAIYGMDLNDEYFRKNGITIDENFRNPYTHITLTVGEIGCALSHYYCWKKAYDDNIDYSIIVESDAIFNYNFKNVVNSVIEKAPSFDLLYLGRKTFHEDFNDVLKINDTYKLVNPSFSYWGIGYMLSKSGIDKYVNSRFLNNVIPIDEFLPLMYLNINSGYYKKRNYNSVEVKALALKPSIITPKKNTFMYSSTENQPYYKLKFPTNFYNNIIQVVTVGTDPVDGYNRFIESTVIYGFPYICLGFGSTWRGNDMANGTGGGHKIVLLQEYLDTFNDNDERIILFSDCYDAVLQGPPNLVINKFVKMKQKEKFDILFSAEALIWPDKSLSSEFPDVGTPYKFLNSGGFIGSIKHLKQLVNDKVECYQDDQLYYQKQYLKSVKNDINLKIKLDATSEIFQTLSSHLNYIKLDISMSKVLNTLTNTVPMVIHGNGDVNSKIFINRICNYINVKYRNNFGYKDSHTIKTKLNIDFDKFPIILAILKIETITDAKNIFNYINCIKKQQYPSYKIHYLILNCTNDKKILKYIMEVTSQLELLLNIELQYTKINNSCSSLRDWYCNILNRIYEKYDYILMCVLTQIINNDTWFIKAICSNLNVVAPMLVSKNNKYTSNFNTELRNDNKILTPEYLYILNRDHKGYWNVPYISGNILINKCKYNEISKAISNETIQDEEKNNFNMFFGRCLQVRGIFMYISNYHEYGYILDNKLDHFISQYD
uniref:Glycosyltransferase n=1 Tax=viral metagenome TaxID=1070528 RepID=A0A6C0BRP7_9ZZZZ